MAGGSRLFIRRKMQNGTSYLKDRSPDKSYRLQLQGHLGCFRRSSKERSKPMFSSGRIDNDANLKYRQQNPLRFFRDLKKGKTFQCLYQI